MTNGKEKFAQGIIVRLFRSWSASRVTGLPELPRMHEITDQLGLPAETGPACASLFELVEAHLGRRLNAECCCSRNLTPDEQAMLGIVAIAASLEPSKGNSQVPHGLSGAIHWAAMAVRRSFSLPNGRSPAAVGAVDQCPFPAHAPEASCGI